METAKFEGEGFKLKLVADKTSYDKLAIEAAKAKRARKNAKRLKNAG